jgi:hypothetical protein
MMSIFEDFDAVGLLVGTLSTATDVPWTLRRRPKSLAVTFVSAVQTTRLTSKCNVAIVWLPTMYKSEALYHHCRLH